MQKRHWLLIAISLGTLLPGFASSAERGAMADFADAVYRLKGLQQTAAAVRDLCVASFPTDAGTFQQGYKDWQAKEASMLAEIAAGYERVLDLKSGGDATERKRVLEQDAALAKLSFEQTKKALDAMPKESLAAKCAGYSNFLLSMNESTPYISTQLRILRNQPGARASSDRP